MKKTILRYGFIAGLVAPIIMLLSLLFGVDHLDSIWGMVIGYAGMIIAFSFIFVAIVKYRDQINNGVISFGRALLIGLAISLIASTMYVAAWMIEYKYVFPDFMDKYAAKELVKMKNDGASETEIQKASTEMAEFKEMYKNPGVRIAFTYAEILPIGIFASLLAAAILRRKKYVAFDA